MLDSSTITTDTNAPSETVRAWDLGVRVFHWLLVLSVLGAGVTGFFAPTPWLDLHLVFGTAIGALLVHRLFWGFLGGAYARFSSFVTSPVTSIRYALSLVRGGSVAHHIGHNPVGAVMIVALLATLLALIVTGVVTLGGAVKDGPLAAVTTYAVGRTAKEVHEALAFALVGLIAFHLLGVIAESLRTRENLAAAMVSGHKRTEGETPLTARARPIIAGLMLLTSGAATAWLVYAGSNRPALGAPVAALDSTYVGECGACHTPHHPSLAPSATWSAILAKLDDHFGDNATLDAHVAQQLGAYLAANSAEHWDTKAANLLRAAEPATGTAPRITETARWKRLHRPVSEAAFKAKPVSGAVNCQACHADAAIGAFKPRNIAIPKEPMK